MVQSTSAGTPSGVPLLCMSQDTVASTAANVARRMGVVALLSK